MMRDRDQCNQFYDGRFGTFAIIKGHGPVALCGEGLIVALHGIHGPEALCGERLIDVLHDVHCQLPLWRGAHCRTQPICHSWQVVCVVPMEITFMDNEGNIFVFDEFIQQMNSYKRIHTCEFIIR
jgi:hypothetical protein